MSENPYAPPKAAVQDVAAAEAEMERPREIKLVVQLAVISYLLGLIVMAISWDYYGQMQSPKATVFGQIFTVAILGLVYWGIYQGRNWGRITWLVFAIIGVIGLSMAYPKMAASLPTLPKAQMAIGFAISLLQLWWMFFSPAKRWFQRKAR